MTSPDAAEADLLRRSHVVAEAKAGSNTSFRLLIGFTFVLLLAPQQVFPVLAPLRLALLMASLTLLMHIRYRISRGLSVPQATPGIMPALLLALWAILNVPLSFWPGGSISFLLGEFFKTLAVFLLLSHVIDNVTKLRQICQALVWMALPLALTTLSHFSSHTFVEDGSRVAGYNSALASNPNDMALMLNLILPFAIALFLDTNSGGTRFWLGLAIVVIVAAVIVTFSRAGFLTLAVIFLLYMWRLRSRPQRAWIPVALVLALLALPLVPSSYYDRLSTITNIEADETLSAQTRWSDMQTATNLVLANPLIGAGPGMAIFAMNQARGATWTLVHNAYLQLAVELGLPGLLLFLVIFRTCLRNTDYALTHSASMPSSTTLFHLAEGIRVSLFAFGAAAMLHPVAYAFYFYYIAGLAVAARAICDGTAGAKSA